MWCVIIPTYNNRGTILQVIEEVLKYTHDIIVVNDGCTDGTDRLLSDVDATIVAYGRNRGKGSALKMGFRKARELGFDYAITIDADGQHFASDIPRFVEAMLLHPDSMIIGSRNLEEEGMPSKNTFANRSSNFWFRLQTGVNLPDTQTGFRSYPLRQMGHMWWVTSRYEAELEMLVYAAWRGIRMIPVSIKVYYPPAGLRVTHFRPIYDFARISLLNTLLCFLAVVYGLPSKLLRTIR
ncbi:MAG: glycosyltransferase family 2 protein [Paraprevotella sp.]|nr:glycosyltransferase family 2 protein [Paraprevotella sp.]